MTQAMPPNWEDAFPDASLSVGLPAKFDSFDKSLIFLDYMSLDLEEKRRWLDRALATSRSVIVLSPTPDDNEAIAAIKAGAVGYGHTYSAPSRLREMSLVVNHGGLWVGSNLMKRVLNAMQKGALQPGDKPAKPGVEKFAKELSEREIAVARFVAQGATNLEISAALDIKERTVKAHITSIFYKLKVRNRVELALRLNDVPLPEPAMEKPSKPYAL